MPGAKVGDKSDFYLPHANTMGDGIPAWTPDRGQKDSFMGRGSDKITRASNFLHALRASSLSEPRSRCQNGFAGSLLPWGECQLFSCRSSWRVSVTARAGEPSRLAGSKGEPGELALNPCAMPRRDNLRHHDRRSPSRCWIHQRRKVPSSPRGAAPRSRDHSARYASALGNTS